MAARGAGAALLRIGGAALVGVAAGYGARVVARRTQEALRRAPKTVDWELVRRYAHRLAGDDGAHAIEFEAAEVRYREFVKDAEVRIAPFMNLELPAPITRVHAVDRAEWLEANFVSLRHTLGPLDDLLERLRGRQSDASVALNAKLASAQIGLLFGVLSRRVLGQYDLSLLSPEPDERGALLFAEPNIDRIARELGLPGDAFRHYIALHEVTHVYQFEACPWMREHFRGLLGRFLETAARRASGPHESPTEFLGRLLRGVADGRPAVEIALGREEAELVARIQAAMSLVEGYSNLVMNDVGRDVLPEFERIEARMKSREQAKPLWLEIFDRVSGLQSKLEQYRRGEAFARAVVAARGIEFLNRVWEAPERLPSMAELERPEVWIDRIEAA